MSDTVRLLEELTIEAAARLRELTAERDRLREEVDALSKRLESLGDGQLTALHARARAVLAEALDELRGERGAG